MDNTKEWFLLLHDTDPRLNTISEHEKCNLQNHVQICLVPKCDLTAAKAEIAELKELIKREVVPDIKDAEITRLKEENEKLENANCGLELIYNQSKKTYESALDVAVDTLVQAKVDMQEDVFNAFPIGEALDKIKQIRGEK